MPMFYTVSINDKCLPHKKIAIPQIAMKSNLPLANETIPHIDKSLSKLSFEDLNGGIVNLSKNF
jgi:hypothetical protein